MAEQSERKELQGQMEVQPGVGGLVVPPKFDGSPSVSESPMAASIDTSIVGIDHSPARMLSDRCP